MDKNLYKSLRNLLKNDNFGFIVPKKISNNDPIILLQNNDKILGFLWLLF